jgi:CPA1 family monovalent cation:H+ antiporter
VSLAAILARIVWVFPAMLLPYLVRRRRARPGSPVVPLPEGRHLTIIAWAGMRGVVSLAAALALPIDFPERDLIIFLTFAVILATLVGQGLTLPILINRLNIDDGAAGTDQEEAFARYVTSDAATARLEELAEEWPGHLELIDNLRAQYDHQSRHAVSRQDPDESDEEAEQELLEHRQIRMGVLTAEREALLALRDRGAISDDVYRRIERDLDLEEIRMQA